MRLVFMGTPPFAVPTLEKLLDSPHEIPLVVTQPDKPAGRGQKLRASPVKELALQCGVDTAEPERLRKDPDIKARLEAVRPDLIIVVAYGQILPKEILDIPRLGCINLHASLLPLYRGAAPINWAIIEGRMETGVTLMEMDEGMDTGGIILQEKVPILEDDDAQSLGDMLSMVGAEALLKVLESVEKSDEILSEPQEEACASSAPLLKKEDGRLDWSQATESIICRVRGLSPWPGAWTTAWTTARTTAWTDAPEGKNLKIHRVETVWASAVEDIAHPEKIAPGTVVRLLRGYGLVLKTGDGYALVTQAQAPGKRAMGGPDMINGKLAKAGDQWGEKPKEEA